jgi:hypothetical protein
VRFSFSVFATRNILTPRAIGCAAGHCTAQRESRAEWITYRVVASLEFPLNDTKLKNMTIFFAESREQVTGEAFVVARRARPAKEKTAAEWISFFLFTADG